jgi:ABC-type branched-subunit amino acid transport system permease subunit
MIYVLAQYWPFLIVAFVIGIPFGWLFHAPAGRRAEAEREDEP